MASQLRAMGFAARCLVGPSWFTLRGLRDAIVVCVKSVPGNPEAILGRGNRLVFDAIDWEPGGASLAPFHAVLCASRHVLRLCRQEAPKVESHVLYHHADPAIQPHLQEVGLRVVYIGEKANSLFIGGQLPDLAIVNFKRAGWHETVRSFNAHFSARFDSTKSVVKLANAAAARAVFVSGPEPGCVELLGADYPFFFHPHEGLPAAKNVLWRARESFRGCEWQEAEERIAAASRQLTLHSSASRLQALLATL